MKTSRDIEYIELVTKAKIRKIKSIVGYVFRNKSFKAPYPELWYSNVCEYFKITPKKALLIATSKDRPTIKIWKEWNSNKEEIERCEENVIQIWKNLAKNIKGKKYR